MTLRSEDQFAEEDIEDIVEKLLEGIVSAEGAGGNREGSAKGAGETDNKKDIESPGQLGAEESELCAWTKAPAKHRPQKQAGS